MQESEYNDGDSNMRRRFAEQTKKFWKESKQKEDTDRPSTREVSGNMQPQDAPSKRSVLRPDNE